MSAMRLDTILHEIAMSPEDRAIWAQRGYISASGRLWIGMHAAIGAAAVREAQLMAAAANADKRNMNAARKLAEQVSEAGIDPTGAERCAFERLLMRLCNQYEADDEAVESTALMFLARDAACAALDSSLHAHGAVSVSLVIGITRMYESKYRLDFDAGCVLAQITAHRYLKTV